LHDEIRFHDSRSGAGRDEPRRAPSDKLSSTRILAWGTMVPTGGFYVVEHRPRSPSVVSEELESGGLEPEARRLIPANADKKKTRRSWRMVGVGSVPPSMDLRYPGVIGQVNLLLRQ